MASVEAALDAAICWVNTFPNLSKTCSTADDLADGITLFEVLANIDPEWFSLVDRVERGNSWVIRFNILKTMYKLLLSYVEEILQGQISPEDTPDLNMIVKDKDLLEIQKLVYLIMVVALLCPKKADYIYMIQNLDPQHQQIIMLNVSSVLFFSLFSVHLKFQYLV